MKPIEPKTTGHHFAAATQGGTGWSSAAWVLGLALCIGHEALAAPDAPRVDLPRMVNIPAGELKTGACPDRSRICDPKDYVAQTIRVAAFKLSATEITFAQWDACVADGGCVSEMSDWAYMNRPVHPPCVPDEVCQYPFDQGWGRGHRPVIHVSWNDAQKYVTWIRRKTGENYRLPTSEEWEYAAKAGSSAKFPWGAALGKNQANCDGCGSRWDNKQSAPVGSFRPNRFGLYDMIGNVNEWVSTCVPTRSPGSQECASYIYRGGAWSSIASRLDLHRFDWVWPDNRAHFIGFRIAQTCSSREPC